MFTDRGFLKKCIWPWQHFSAVFWS